MRDWLKATLVRLAVAGVVVALLGWLFLVRPANQAKQLIKQQKNDSAQNLNAINKISQALASIPDLADLKTQQASAIKSYADQVQKASGMLNRLDIVRTGKLSKIIGLDWGKNGRIVTSVNRTISSANSQSSKNNIFADWTTAKELASYHTQVSRALVNILEYNPTVDTANFVLGSDDTNQRLNLASQGLAKTISSLQAVSGKYNDPALGDVISQIQSLQQARDQLAKDGNSAAWINAVSQTQAKIIFNRSSFWRSQVNQINKSLNRDESALDQNQKLWNELAAKYRL